MKVHFFDCKRKGANCFRLRGKPFRDGGVWWKDTSAETCAVVCLNQAKSGAGLVPVLFVALVRSCQLPRRSLAESQQGTGADLACRGGRGGEANISPAFSGTLPSMRSRSLEPLCPRAHGGGPPTGGSDRWPPRYLPLHLLPRPCSLQANSSLSSC